MARSAPTECPALRALVWAFCGPTERPAPDVVGLVLRASPDALRPSRLALDAVAAARRACLAVGQTDAAALVAASRATDTWTAPETADRTPLLRAASILGRLAHAGECAVIDLQMAGVVERDALPWTYEGDDQRDAVRSRIAGECAPIRARSAALGWASLACEAADAARKHLAQHLDPATDEWWRAKHMEQVADRAGWALACARLAAPAEGDVVFRAVLEREAAGVAAPISHAVQLPQPPPANDGPLFARAQ